MVSRRPSPPPPDRIVRLLQEPRDDAARVGGAVPAAAEPGPDTSVPTAEQWEQEGDDWDDLLGPDGPAQPSGRHRRARVPLLSVPAALRSAQLGVGARAVRGLLVLAFVAVLVLGGRWLWSQRPAGAAGVERVAGAEEVAGAGGETLPADAEDGAGEGTEEGEESSEETTGDTVGHGAADEEDLVVHVTGAVGEPGVVELPAGSRVVDAVRAAGGLTREADESSVNLARPLVDGEQLWVGRPGEEPPAGWSPPAQGGSDGGGSRDATGGGAEPAPLDLNAATQADLEELPGIGPVTAGHILTWRDEHGRFSRVDELLEVSGIGERTLAQLEPLVTVDG